MKCPPIPPDEKERLLALASYGLSGERPLPTLDAVVKLATYMFDIPTAGVNMIGSDHVFLAAKVGMGTVDLRCDVSFCAHAITQHGVMVVRDSLLDERFNDNPLVTGHPHLRFYAGVPLMSASGHALGALCIIDTQPRDFSEEDGERLKELAQMAADRLELRRLELSTENARLPFDDFARHSPTAVVWFDAQRRLIAWNEAAASLHGYALNEGPGMLVDDLLPPNDRAAFQSLVRQAMDAGTFDGMDMPQTAQGLRKNGSQFDLGLSLFCWRENGQMVFNAHVQDVSMDKPEEEFLLRLATTDLLTGLANRARFYRAVEDALTGSRSAAVLILDIDGFKNVNDTLGHAVGDGILCEVARRLEDGVGASGLVARLGSDEFAVLLHERTQPLQAQAMADVLLDTLAHTIVVDQHEIQLTASCGIAAAPEHALEALALTGNADLALIHGKRLGGAQSFLFVPALRVEAVTRHRHGLELHRAVQVRQPVLGGQSEELRTRIRVIAKALAGQVRQEKQTFRACRRLTRQAGHVVI